MVVSTVEVTEVTDVSPLVWESFLWGLLSAISLNIGSIIGVTCLPGQKTRAVLMSFGGGALLFALSIELFGHVLEESRAPGGSTNNVWAMEGSAVVGGVFFAVLNNLLNDQGAALRKPSTTKSRFARMRSLLMRRLAVRLLKIPFFSVLSLEELKDLIQSAMYKQRYAAGDVIMSGDTRDNGIYFILSGVVQVELLCKETKEMARISTTSQENLHRAPTDVSLALNTWDLGTNQIFGEMCLLAGSDIQTRAIAKEKTKVLVLPGHEVAQLIDSNLAVRDQVSLRAVERLRQVKELRHLPDHALASLSTKSTLKRFQAGEVIFEGTVDELTPIFCLVLGSAEVHDKESGHRRVFNASCLLCTEHLKTGSDSDHFKAMSLETTSVLVLDREDINNAMLRSPDSSNGFMRREVAALEAAKATAMPGQVLDPLEVTDLDLEEAAAKRDREMPEQTPEKPSKSATRYMLPANAASEGVMALSAQLGWDDTAPTVEPEEVTRAMGTVHLEQVTDMELEENDIEFLAGEYDRAVSKSSRSSHTANLRLRPGQVTAPASEDLLQIAESKVDDLELQKLQNPEKSGEKAHGGHGAGAQGSHRAIMVWLGILIDAVPESLVIGILINKSVTGNEAGPEERSSRAAAAAMPFVIGVFLSNLPEAMSSSGSMKAHGMRVSTILLMWLTTTILTALGAVLGSVCFPPGSSGDESASLIVSSVEGLAAGAMLTMIAQTMMPEAFEQGGDVVGLSCLAGFLCALSVKLIPA
eukprot:gb/GFBE01000675.1/.p1 GENE.gb/GFBE01000675.1/~~gb/GFBE01000675.1/.p1  ORF type:complete len:756 (+),score=175.56 gb/GFBE01000675.1/:1-2268(+)